MINRSTCIKVTIDGKFQIYCDSVGSFVEMRSKYEAANQQTKISKTCKVLI